MDPWIKSESDWRSMERRALVIVRMRYVYHEVKAQTMRKQSLRGFLIKDHVFCLVSNGSETVAVANLEMKIHTLTQQEEAIGKAVVNAAYKVHIALGPGLLEKIYETCVCHEIRKAGFTVDRQVSIPIVYDGIEFDEALRLDLLVEAKVVVE